MVRWRIASFVFAEAYMAALAGVEGVAEGSWLVTCALSQVV
jgi:hypothetical protein